MAAPHPILRRLPVPALLALFVAACGSEADSPAAPVVQRLELRPVGELALARSPRITARLEIPAQVEPWTVADGTASLAPEREDGVRRLALQGPEQKTLSIPGPFDPSSFDLAAVQIVTWSEHKLFAQLVRDGWGALSAEPRRLVIGSQASAVLLEFPKLAGQSEPFDRLVLSFRGAGACMLERGIELIERPPAALLPDPAGPPELVLVGKDWRRASTLSAANPLVATASVPARGFLSFAHGLPEGLDRTAGVQLRVRVAAAGRAPVEWTVPSLPAPRKSWRTWIQDLGAFANEEVTITLELDAPGDPEAGDQTALLAVAEPLVFSRAVDAPTVLLVTSDTHRADHLGVAGLGVDVSTPALDALAARGVLFEDCFSATNVTNPSHIALMTATSPRDTGIVNNFSALSDAAPTLAEHFAAAGFVTFASTSAPHLGHPTSGLGQGFDRMSFPRRDRDAEPTIAALEPWLADAEGLPLFVWLHLFDAHTPYGPPRPWTAGYWPKERDAFDPSLPAEGLPEMEWPPGLQGLRDLEYPLALYRGEVSYLDDRLGRLLALPRFAQGIVGVTADHGESFGAHGVYYGHEGLYPDTIHVPLIVAWPGAPAGTRVTAPVRQIDLGSTLLELAGVPRDGFPGQSLLETIAGSPPSAPRFALAAHEKSASITSDGWHLVLYLTVSEPTYGTSRYPRHRVELFDLRADPKCERDLSDLELERARRMRTSLVRWVTEAPATTWLDRVSEDAELLAELEKLGYTTGADAGGDGKRFDPDCACEECARFR